MVERVGGALSPDQPDRGVTGLVVDLGEAHVHVHMAAYAELLVGVVTGVTGQ